MSRALVLSTDLNGDGDMDIPSAFNFNYFVDEIAWYGNLRPTTDIKDNTDQCGQHSVTFDPV